MMAKLLISVRSPAEAEAALEGGAAIIDVKEPLHGSLGCAGTRAIAGVVKAVRGRVPMSAALGELNDGSQIAANLNLSFVKWGLAGAGPAWRNGLLDASDQWRSFNRNCQPVAVAYADWAQARSPLPQAVLEFVHENRWSVLLLDTFQKDGRTLLDWTPLDEISEICRRCRERGILLALAGSLGSREISQLLPLQPDVFAVRGAVCRRRDRIATVNATLVRQLATLLSGRESGVLAESRCSGSMPGSPSQPL